jgi:hypothetical protein
VIYGRRPRHHETIVGLDQEGADPTADSVAYRQGVLWLSSDELAEMIDAVGDVLASKVGNEPGPGRSPHLLSMILFPTEEPLQPGADQQAKYHK